MDSLSPEVTGPLAALSNALTAAVDLASQPVVEIKGGRRVRSSGVHWSQGKIVTVAHGIRHDQDLKITVADGRVLPATLVGRDPGSDLALLTAEGLDIPVAKFAQPSSTAVGRLAIAIARIDGGASASLGIINLVGGAWRAWRGGLVDQLIRPDIALYNGFSGGPLVDAGGLTIGINTSGLSRSAALTIPAATVNRITDELSRTGRISRGFLGVGLYTVKIPRRIVETHGLRTAAGLIVVNVEPDGPADKAGLLVGDVLIALNGVPVSETDDVQSVLDPEPAGKQITASIIRGGLPLEVAITVGERPRKTC